METIGQRLRALRLRLGLSQYQVATATGITRGNICNYELDKFAPTAETLIRLAAFFGVSIDWLLTGNVSCSLATQEKEQFLLEQFRSLPPDLQNEVLDFVAFLQSRRAAQDENDL
ncbi:MAG TPA: helix-turn-helix domain-containing protein [Firmicutes bacterium]|jgi:transcriptional regulator with XRE-family HTH domain|uniref:helix-turn-helix domain-containing protein n=1 Tax=Gelria sp. Kuro-4 TaxID=2796927 RepID=UPI0019C6F67C|nr:helix-turn-helix domain-containing protein [Gelria sp. Kuro-4]BCV25180.1 hypothetical protein kuro4_19530 [Gelria sp. Kuro-4]HHV58088.1 helix-turn-helix domain-containing protein [Bacillota bacterium]